MFTMKVSSLLASVVLGAFVLVYPAGQRPVLAELFGVREMDRDDVVAIAVPIDGGEAYNLLIVEQLGSGRDCWREQGSEPTVVDPLLLNFDFTNICGRSTDSNGYSLRLAGEEMSWRYALRIVREGNELKLKAFNAENPWRSPIEVGSTKGLAQGFLKIYLNEGWEMGKRTYQGKALGHIYIVNEQSVNSLIANASPSQNAVAVAPRQRDLTPAPVLSESTSTESVQIFVPPSSGVTRTPAQLVPTLNASTVPVPSLTSMVPDLPSVPVPNTPIPTYESDNSGLIRLNTTSQQPPPPPISLAESLGLQYKLVVDATTPSQKEALKSIVPDAFHTWVGDRRMMQAGAFKDETEAKELQERLSQIGLSSQIISIR